MSEQPRLNGFPDTVSPEVEHPGRTTQHAENAVAAAWDGLSPHSHPLPRFDPSCPRCSVATDSMGEAWAAAETALPSEWALALRHNPNGRWTATAFNRLHGRIHDRVTMDRFPSPESALRAVADALESRR